VQQTPLQLDQTINYMSVFRLVNSAVNMALPARRSAANPLNAAAAVKWWDKQTDGQTDVRPSLPTVKARWFSLFHVLYTCLDARGQLLISACRTINIINDIAVIDKK